MFGGNIPSIPLTAPITGGYNTNDGWGNNGAWWIIIILFAIFGWGRGGYGYGNGDGCNCNNNAISADLQRGFDNQTVVNKLNGLENGICSLGYDQLNQMNGINQTVMQTGWGIQNAIHQMGVANMQDTNALSRQLADCCCENRQAIAQVRYDMATDTCSINTNMNNAARDIIENNNCNFRSLDARLTQMEMARKDEKIADQASQIQALNLAVSQRNQNDYLINQLRPCPVPAYITCNPFAAVYSGGCGCGNGFGYGAA